MGGSTVFEDWELTSPSSTVSNLVLVGRTGNGKSATGNSILGKKIFLSKRGASSVTTTCELKTAVLPTGCTVNVVDTPGLFDTIASPAFIGKEIVRCVNLCKDGIHAVLIVISALTRFTKEEIDAYRGLQTLFGPSIFKYMIVVITGGDVLEANDETLEDYLDGNADLKELLQLCNGRVMLFNNMTKDEHKKYQQVQQLLLLADAVLSENGGRPYSNEIFNELKDAEVTLQSQKEKIETLQGYSKEDILQLKEELQQSYKLQLDRMTEMVETKLRETTLVLERKLAAEQAARKLAEFAAQKAQMESNKEIIRLRESLEEARRETQSLREQASKCSIL